MRGPIPLGRQLLLLERIAVGGMAEVYRAKSFGAHGFERIVAVKRILQSMAEDEEFVRMFVDEARLASYLTHQNIVQIFDFGQVDRVHYFSMEYVAGRDLRTILDRFKRLKQPMDPTMASAVIVKVAEALDYAHRKKEPSGKDYKIIHRDVSPQNVILSYEGEVKLCDFGIAKAATQSTRTQVGVLKGKFAYMSPEQVRGRQIDRRSDIFALGVIFYEMLTGERLFLADSDYATLEAVRNAKVTPPRQHNPALPPRLEEICVKMLAREPAERYQWGSEVLEDLTRYIVGAGQIFHAHHLRQFMHDAYADEIAAENAKMEAFSSVRMPVVVEEPKPVASVLEGLGMLGSGPKQVTPDESSGPELVKPVDGTPKKRAQHDDMSATVMSDEGEDDSAAATLAKSLSAESAPTMSADDATGDLAKEIEAAQKALLERMSSLGESATADVKPPPRPAPAPLPRIIAPQDDEIIDDGSGASRTMVEDPAEDEAGRTGDMLRPPEFDPPPKPPDLPVARPSTEARRASQMNIPAGMTGRHIKERAAVPKSDLPPPIAPRVSAPIAPMAPPVDGPRTPPPVLDPAAMAPPIALHPLPQAPARSQSAVQPRLLLFGAALIVLVTIGFLAIVLWSQQSGGASLLVETSPVREVEVYLDGHLITVGTPIEVDKLQLGDHTIEVRAPGFHTYKQTFSIQENRPHTLAIPLEARGGSK